jgi:hypothetical protein
MNKLEKILLHPKWEKVCKKFDKFVKDNNL